MRCTTLRHCAAVAVTVLGFAACTDNETPDTMSPNGDSRLSVVLSVESDTIPESLSKIIVARVYDRTGALKLEPVTWKSSNASVASVSAGAINGVGAGTAMIIASSGSGADTVTIVVTPKQYLLDVQPTGAIVAVGDTINFKAILRSNTGEIITVNNLTWSSSDTAAARFVSGGSLVGKGEGEFHISAEGVNARGTGSVKVFRTPVSSVTITPSTANVTMGAQLQLAVTLRDQQGRLTENNVTFGSSDYSKATVNQDGMVKGLAAGTVVITATSGTKTGSATINVLGTPASSVSLALPSDTVPIGVEVQVTATPLDESGNPLTGRTIAYQSANPAVATITSTGVVKGVIEGSTTISAIVDAKVASKRISVGGRRAASIEISPQSPSVNVGKQTQLTAKVLDQAGVEIAGYPVNWSTANSSIAQVSSTGLVTAISAGSTSISAASGALSASTALTVVSAPVAAVQVSPSTASVVVGGSVTLTATAIDAEGKPLSGRVATWSSQNPTVVSVNSSGVVSAIGSGSTTVNATIEGNSASATVNVGVAPAVPVSSVTVTLETPALNVGQQTQAHAILRDAQGNVLSRAITWNSLDTAVAKVSSSGLVTAYAAGTVAIMARSEGVSGSTSLTVNTPAPAPVAQVLMSVPTHDLLIGQSIQAVVTLKDAQGNTLLGRTVTYSTEHSSYVTVSATGVIKGVGAGSANVTATSGGVSASQTFHVTEPPQTVASIAVAPSSVALAVGQTTQAIARASDGQGNPISGTSFSWTTSNPGVATVSGTGVVSAVGPGAATVRASASGVTGSMSVNVASVSAPVASVTVTLTPNLQIGGTTQASAIARDASGNVLGGKTFVWTSATTSVASVSSSGVVTGLSSGTAQIRATTDGVLGASTVTVSTTTSLTVPPELPRVIPSWQDPYPGRGCSVTVAAGGNVSEALSTARGGSVVCLTAGATYGQVLLPARASGDTGWIVLRTATTLPAEGTRIRPSAAGGYATIATPSSECAIRTAPGTSGYYVAGVRIGTSASMTYQLACLGSNGSEQDVMAEAPQGLVLSRVLIDGGSAQIQRCVGLNSGATAIVDSWLMNCHIKGFEGHGIAGWNGPGPFLIENNYVEAAGINLMFGGATPSIANLRSSDITIRRNHLIKPLSWGPAGTGAGPWTEKNLLEMKNAARVLIEGNVFENSWQDAQPTGSGIMLKSINDEGNCGWCQSSDLTIRRNFGTNIETPIVMSAAENYNDPSRPPPALTRVHIAENVFDNSGAVAWGAKGVQLTAGHSNTGASDVLVERNVIAQGPGKTVAHMLLVSSPGTQRSVFRDNVWTHGMYPILNGEGAFGALALNLGAPSAVWSNMFLVKSPNHTDGTPAMPAGTNVVTSESSTPLAAQIRSAVAATVAGVVVVP